MNHLPFGLQPELSQSARIEPVGPGAWRLWIPPGPAGRYRLAQLDNYGASGRGDFPHRAPFSLLLEARASAAVLPGTWGFGVWNDPFSMGTLTGRGLRFPALPNAAWFFFASAENYLSFRSGLAASGALAGVFQAPRWPGGLLALGIPALALMAAPPGRRFLRKLAARVVQEGSAPLAIDPAEWHFYRIEWQERHVHFQVDEKTVLQTDIAPNGPLGLVIWIDNQYAAFRPDGSLGYGMLANPEPAWIEVQEIRLTGIELEFTGSSRDPIRSNRR